MRRFGYASSVRRPFLRGMGQILDLGGVSRRRTTDYVFHLSETSKFTDDWKAIAGDLQRAVGRLDREGESHSFP